MKDGELNFDDIEKAVRNRERMKIYTIHNTVGEEFGHGCGSQCVFLNTGFVKNTERMNISEAKIVSLQPAIFINIESANHPEKETKRQLEVGVEAYYIIHPQVKLSKIYSVTTSYDEHVLKSSPLVRQLCGEETKSFKDYLRLARYL